MRTSSLLFGLLLACTFTVRPSVAATYPPEQQSASFAPTARLTDGAFAGWHALTSAPEPTSTRYWGRPVDLGTQESAALLARVQQELALPGDFELLTRNPTPTREYVIYRNTVNGLPVVGGRLDVVLNKRGEVARVLTAAYSEWPTDGAHTLSLFVAAEHLRLTLPVARWEVQIENSSACWYPDLETGALLPAYWLVLAGSRPNEKHAGIVDARTGTALLDWPGIAHDVITLTLELPYWQPYDHSPVQLGPCAHQRVTINGNEFTTGLNGVVSAEAGETASVLNGLSGDYVMVIDDDDGEESFHANVWTAPFTETTWAWTEEDATRPELNLYYHTEFIHDWYKVLDPAFNALDYPMPAVANFGNSYDNAFWDGYGTYYGSGMNLGDFAMYSDVIYHEYTHGVTDGIYPDNMLPYVGQPGALNEAWSDYFGCTINGDPLMGEWLTGNAHNSLRDLESNMHYPEAWVGEVHGDSPFISVPLWRLREWLGTGLADSLAHFARYGLAETFMDYLIAVLEADDTDGNLENGTPHASEIYDAFGRSGIGPGIEPNFVFQNITLDDGMGGNGLLEAGETAVLTFTLVNDVELFPPAAANVTLSATTGDPTLSLNNTDFQIGTLGPRDSVLIGPLQISASPSAHDHWGVVSFEISSDQLEHPLDLTIEFTVGIPKVRVVTRDVESELDKFVTGTLREMDRIFSAERLSAPNALDLSSLPDTGLVIYMSGNLSVSGLTAEDQAELITFALGGGRIMLTGKSILGDLEGSGFARDFLGVDADGVSRLRMVTPLTDMFEPEATYLLTGSGGAANQDSMTKLEALSGSQEVLRYGPTGANIAGVLGYEGRALTLGFGIEAIADNSPIGNLPRSEFLSHILEWAGQPLAADDERNLPLLPGALELTSAYPNPFNSTVQLEYSLGNALQAELLIYDVLGREVHRMMLSRSSGVVSWSPTLASGVYFATLYTPEQKSAPRKLLLMR